MTPVPVQVPLWHVSFVVQASPSLQVVPSVFGVATQRFVRPSDAHVPVLQASLSELQSALLVQRTVFTHSEGEDDGDDEAYEQTSRSSGVVLLGKSLCLTQHWACVSRVEQLVPLQTLPLLC